MNFHTRKWVKPEDLNPNGSLFGGRLLEWIDEEAALYTIIQLENQRVLTDTFMESIAPLMGMLIFVFAACLKSSLNPVASVPTAIAQPPV